MAQYADSLDVHTLNLPSGGGARLDAVVRVNPMAIGGQRYAVAGDSVEARVEVSRMTSGFAFRLRYPAEVRGPCMRCLAAAAPTIHVDAREVERPGDAEELHSPYFKGGELELARWVRDALVLALPSQLLCREDCAGLCAVCGENLNDADPAEHRHEGGGESPFAKLSELKLR